MLQYDPSPVSYYFFFFNDTATTEIYTLSLHDALPICDGLELLAGGVPSEADGPVGTVGHVGHVQQVAGGDRKSTRLNSSHSQISYAVFCLKKKKINVKFGKCANLCVRRNFYHFIAALI